MRPDVRVPVKSLHRLVRRRQLGKRIGIVFRRIVVINPVQFAVNHIGGHHFAFDLVDGRNCIVLLEIEQSHRPAERIETLQGRRSVEIRHHVRALDLVKIQTVFLSDYKGVGHKAGPVHSTVSDEH